MFSCVTNFLTSVEFVDEFVRMKNHAAFRPLQIWRRS